MPLLDVQGRMREVGRIRLGQQVEVKGGRKRPAKLETFRLTSPSQPLIRAAAELLGGEVKPWQSPAGLEYELITPVDALDVLIPPGQQLSQWYELWSGGGCQRRCDGYTETLSGGSCMCPADPAEKRDLAAVGEACKPTTRLNVMLPMLPDLGVWRLETHGYYAAVELAGTAQFLAAASAAGRPIRAVLRLEQREKKVPGKPVNRYAVPVLELPGVRLIDLLEAAPGTALQGAQPQLTALAGGQSANQRPTGRVPRPALPQGPQPPAETAFQHQESPPFPDETPLDERPPTPPADPETGEVLEEDIPFGGPVAAEDPGEDDRAALKARLDVARAKMAGSKPTPNDLVTRLKRAEAAVQDQVNKPATDEQKQQLAELFAGIDHDIIRRLFAAAFDPGITSGRISLNRAWAHAVLQVAKPDPQLFLVEATTLPAAQPAAA